MALTHCKECNQQISNKAEACPHCGAKVPKKTSKVTWLVVGILAIGLIGALTAKAPDTTKQAATDAAKTPAPPSKRDLQLRAGGAGALALKNASKDPETFELKAATVMADGTTCYSYRAKNSFGAMLAGDAVLTSSGKILVHEKDGNAFVSVWNKNCTKAGGNDIASY